MFYYIYQITNKVNGKIYVGVHKTRNLDDGYMGSGKVIKSAIKKYGLDNFTKDILEFFETSEEMYVREKEVVTDEFLLREDTYNLRRGGTGGFDYINNNPDKFLTEKRLNALWSIEDRRNVYLYKLNNDEDFYKKRCEHLKHIRDIALQKYPDGAFKGRQHSHQTKEIMSVKASERLKDPTKNSQYGTMWITDGVSSKKINSKDKIPNGWKKGRVLTNK